jgi:hypothetical protein
VARYEMETRVAHISSEMDKVQEKMERVDKSDSRPFLAAAPDFPGQLLTCNWRENVPLTLGATATVA